MFGGTVKLANNKYRKVQYNQLTGFLGFIDTFEKIKVTVFPSSQANQVFKNVVHL